MSKLSRSQLLHAAQELGISLPEEEFGKLLENARAADDPLAVLRAAAAPGLEPAAETELEQETNTAVAVMEPPPEPDKPRYHTPRWTKEALARMIGEQREDLPKHHQAALRDVAFALPNGDEQTALIAAWNPPAPLTPEEFRAAMRKALGKLPTSPPETPPPSVDLPDEQAAKVIGDVGHSHREMLLALESLIFARLATLPQDYWRYKWLNIFFDKAANVMFVRLFGDDERKREREVGAEVERVRRLVRELQAAGTDAERQASRQRADDAAGALAQRAPKLREQIERQTRELRELEQVEFSAQQELETRETAIATARKRCIPAYVLDEVPAEHRERAIDEYLAGARDRMGL